MLKERASGMYRLSAFFLARQLSDLPMDFAIPTGEGGAWLAGGAQRLALAMPMPTGDGGGGVGWLCMDQPSSPGRHLESGPLW